MKKKTKKRKKIRKRKKTRKTNRKKRFKKRSLRRRRRIGKSKKRQKKKVKQLIRRKKVRSKKTKRRKSFFKKARTSSFKKSIKKRFSFSLRELFKKIVSPVVDRVRDYQKKRQLLKSKKIKEEEKRKQKEIKAQSDLRKELLKKEIKEEKAVAKTRTIELKSFLREEQKLIREKEKIKQEKFLEEVRLEKTLEKFRKRELSEIQAIEKYTLNIEKEDFKAFQQRIDQVREKYKALRNERLRKRVEELGVTFSDQATVEEIRQKEKEYIQRRELIETSLESFVRSATSLIYQINKRYLPRNADLLRVINLVYEQSEIIIREDQEQNENFLMLIYVKDQDINKNLIIVEDKTNSEKHETREYNRSQIFKFGDDLADSMVRYLERIRERIKKAS
jgi:hypothetical protein